MVVLQDFQEGENIIRKNDVFLCVLDEDCDQIGYVKLVKTLWAEHNLTC